MRKFDFEIEDDESLIILEGYVHGYLVRLALDTAATHSVIDFNVLLILGYSNQDIIETIPLETANGIMQAHKYRI
jgi:predicted aspartyl protease